MDTSKFSSRSPRLWCGLVLTLIACSLTASAAVNGALQTTDESGNIVNYNTGLACNEVYITGGPQNTNPFGLTPGTYYFRVTDPSGSTVLSPDAGTATLEVTINSDGKGVISQSDDLTNHPQGATGSPNLLSGETTVRLWPFTQTPNNGGVYKAWISTDPTFKNSTTKTDNFKCTFVPPNCDDPVYAAAHQDECGTPPPPSADIIGEKFYDSNANGLLDQGELGIQGWQIRANPTTLSGSCQLTDENGMYEFAADPADPKTYTISEDDAQQASWVHTTQTSDTVDVTGEGTFDGPNFGNVCVGAGGGLTLGYWSNKNGQAIITSADLLLLRTLNLRNSDGSVFDPTTATQVKNWLLSATATNMAYMLSAQLAAMELNVQHTAVSKVDPSALVYLGPPPTLTTLASCFEDSGAVKPNPANFISITDLMNDANIELGLYPNTVSSTDYRTCENYKKTALDKANNSLNFLQTDQSKCPAFTFANACQ